MGTTADKLAYLEETKAEICGALEAKGAGAASAATFREYAQLILGLEGSSPRKDVNFLDYDGGIVASFTLDELEGLGAPPAAPEHEGLVFLCWTQSLESLRSEARPADVGAVYGTDDGATRLMLSIGDVCRGDISLVFRQSVGSGVEVDWGDGSAAETFPDSTVFCSHDYASPGDYTLSLLPAEGCVLTLGDGTADNGLMGDAYALSRAQAASLKRLHLGARTVVGDYAFNGCCGLRCLTLPNSVTELGECAFQGCTALTAAVLPPSLLSIGDMAFLMCSALRDVVFAPCDVGYAAFSTCAALRSVCLPGGVEAIADEAFFGCTGIDRLSLPEGLLSIGAYAFYSCSGLTGLSLPDSLVSLGDSAFYLCYSLSKLDMGAGLEDIGASAFNCCSAFASVTLPSGLAGIGDAAFGFCQGAGRFVLQTLVPPSAGDAIFDGLQDDCVILVPPGSLSAYLAAEGWSEYADYIQAQ